MPTTKDMPITTPEERAAVIGVYALGNITLTDTTTELAEFVQIVCEELQALRAALAEHSATPR